MYSIICAESDAKDPSGVRTSVIRKSKRVKPKMAKIEGGIVRIDSTSVQPIARQFMFCFINKN